MKFPVHVMVGFVVAHLESSPDSDLEELVRALIDRTPERARVLARFLNRELELANRKDPPA